MWYFRVWLLAPVLCYLSSLVSCADEKGRCCSVFGDVEGRGGAEWDNKEGSGGGVGVC